MEFMLRMEVMGPKASTPHPRPGQPWEPTLRVGEARRLMLRMLAESRVEVAYRKAQVQPLPSFETISGAAFATGQNAGTALALAHCLGKHGLDAEDEPLLRARLSRDLALPG